MIYYWIEAIVLVFIPASVRGKDVAGELVLVTGAGSGLGRCLALRFALRGCRLVLWDINKTGNEETAEQIRKLGTTVTTYTVDLSKKDDIYRTADRVKTDVGEVDILVNNAGIVTGKKFLECPDAMIQKTMDVNVIAHFWTVKSFLPEMLERNHGHIISIASLAGLFGVNGLADYCASKFGAVGFNESIRFELESLGKTGVHTTVVCPFYINTGMFEGVKVRFPKIMPFLDQDVVADRIMDAVLCNQPVLLLPRTNYVTYMLRGILPNKSARVLNNFLGINNTMDEFRGRQKTN